MVFSVIDLLELSLLLGEQEANHHRQRPKSLKIVRLAVNHFQLKLPVSPAYSLAYLLIGLG
jgi:hypothetical protein